MEIFSHIDTWVALLTLTFLEIVLGIDNIIFISITAGKLPENQVKKATNIGLMLAMLFRILLLIGVSYIIAMKDTLFVVDLSWFQASVSGQSLILLGGGFPLFNETPNKLSFELKVSKVFLNQIVQDKYSRRVTETKRKTS